MKASQSGFSMIEIMVAMVIIGVMMGVMIPVFVGNDDKARVSAAKQDIMAISQALDMYKLDNRKYPSSDQGLDALVTGGEAGGQYLKKLKNDPWGNPYQYLSQGSSYELYSLGADNTEGGDGYDADVNYADL